ncbi:hypothetical protein [Methylotuvimicrobium buryatense]|uniref:hypothetical protein n=1 Tax=Methylotuvimicrobium buryatense TaxID=95641 RepID=UPI00034D301A|nr:hypothetical protein [Methylotuvimicrobium buryatense]
MNTDRRHWKRNSDAFETGGPRFIDRRLAGNGGETAKSQLAELVEETGRNPLKPVHLFVELDSFSRPVKKLEAYEVHSLLHF